MSNQQLAGEIQKLLGIIHAQSSGNDMRLGAQNQLDQLIAQNVDIVIPACLVLLQETGDSLSGHFALSTISKFVIEKGPTLSEPEWRGLKAGLLSLFQAASGLPFFLMSKLVDVICEVAIMTWPQDWEELLQSVMSNSSGWGLCVFSRISLSLSEESLSVRCIAPERQLSIRCGIAKIAEPLIDQMLMSLKAHQAWTIELINGLAVATKQSSFLMKKNLHNLVLAAFFSSPDSALKMLCVECLSNMIHFLHGQSGRSYTIARGTREQDSRLLHAIVSACMQLLQPQYLSGYCEHEELRDSMRAFLDLMTDIRKTPNIFALFNGYLTVFSNALIDIASTHPSLQVQIAALGNIDAMLRGKQLVADRRVYLLCFLACHDIYTAPPKSMFPSLSSAVRRVLCEQECEEEDMKPNELVGKLKNVALLCVRHITTGSAESLIAFLKEILSEAITAGGASSSYYPALLFTEAVSTSLSAGDSRREEISKIIDIVASTCVAGKEQDYLWFLGKAGALISSASLEQVFEKILLKMDIASQFPVQLAFISLCKNNAHSANYVQALHDALQQALGTESRSWAIGAILSASAHGGVGAADNFAANVFKDISGKLNLVASSTVGNLEEFAKRSTPLFATLKAVLEVPLSANVSEQIACEVAANLIPFCWTRLLREQENSVFQVGQNEYLSVLGAQFTQTVATCTASHTNAAFQMYLLLTQVAGLCFAFAPKSHVQPLISLFDPAWDLRPSLVNILVSNVAGPACPSRPNLVVQFALPAAIKTLQSYVAKGQNDDFTLSSISRASVSIVQALLSALQITTDDEFVVSDFSGVPKTQKQLKASIRSRNRFAAIAEDAVSLTVVGHHRIPSQLVSDPNTSLSVLALCLQFRTDKALRRISQTVPTIITRWWNSVSHDPVLAASFAAALPQHVLHPILSLLLVVRNKDPSTLPGGQLYSYTCERAASGRRLASELVDHSTISIHGILSVLYKFSAGKNSPPLNQAVQMLVGTITANPSAELLNRISACAREQSLESRASLKHIVESVVNPCASSSLLSANATSKDLSQQREMVSADEDHAVEANIFA